MTSTLPAPEQLPESGLLKRGPFAATAITIPAGCTAVRFEAAGNAQVMYQFHGEIMQGLTLATATGPRTVEVMPGNASLSVIRIDDGEDDVRVTLETCTG